LKLNYVPIYIQLPYFIYFTLNFIIFKVTILNFKLLVCLYLNCYLKHVVNISSINLMKLKKKMFDVEYFIALFYYLKIGTLYL